MWKLLARLLIPLALLAALAARSTADPAAVPAPGAAPPVKPETKPAAKPDAASGQVAGDFPDGQISHAGGTISGGFIVYEVWESKAKHEDFMAGRLGAALGAVGVPQPRKVTEVDVVGYHTS